MKKNHRRPRSNHGGMWFVINTAVSSGWGATLRLLLIVTAIGAVLIAAASLGIISPLGHLAQFAEQVFFK